MIYWFVYVTATKRELVGTKSPEDLRENWEKLNELRRHRGSHSHFLDTVVYKWHAVRKGIMRLNAYIVCLNWTSFFSKLSVYPSDSEMLSFRLSFMVCFAIIRFWVLSSAIPAMTSETMLRIKSYFLVSLQFFVSVQSFQSLTTRVFCLSERRRSIAAILLC